MGGRGYVHAHRHPQTFQERQLVSHPGSLRAALWGSSQQHSATGRKGASLALAPPIPCPLLPPPPGAGSSQVCRHHHNKPGGEGAQDEMLVGKFPLSSACSSWLALQSTAVYSPYKNIYIETACSYAYKATVFRLGQAPTPYSGAGNNPASQ